MSQQYPWWQVAVRQLPWAGLALMLYAAWFLLLHTAPLRPESYVTRPGPIQYRLMDASRAGGAQQMALLWSPDMLNLPSVSGFSAPVWNQSVDRLPPLPEHADMSAVMEMKKPALPHYAWSADSFSSRVTDVMSFLAFPAADDAVAANENASAEPSVEVLFMSGMSAEDVAYTVPGLGESALSQPAAIAVELVFDRYGAVEHVRWLQGELVPELRRHIIRQLYHWRLNRPSAKRVVGVRLWFPSSNMTGSGVS